VEQTTEIIARSSKKCFT